MDFINKILSSFFGNKAERDIKEIMPYVTKTEEEYEKLKSINHDSLRQKSTDLKNRITAYISEENQQIQSLKEKIEKENIDYEDREEIYDEIDQLEKVIDEKLNTILLEILPEAFAVVRETARRFKENETISVTANDFDRDMAASRDFVEIKGNTAVYKNSWIAGGSLITWDMVHYQVQLIGGVALHQGRIAEMATGEGKTLVATLPVFLNALTGRGVHLVTVNDYLAKRDAEWMGPIYQFHGLSVDCIDKHQPNSEDRRKAYLSDITFGTNNEFGFDYLRDNMAINPEDLVQRVHNFGIVDEVDSVLIDDARTPLIISGPVPKGDDQLFEELKPRIVQLVNVQRKLTTNLLAEAKKLISEGEKLIEAGKKSDGDKKREQGSFKLLQAHKGFPKTKALIKYLSEHGIRTMMKKTEDIYLAENAKRMPEVTGDLYFVIEEQHNSIDLTDKGIDFLTQESEDPNFFVLPSMGEEVAMIEKSELSASEIVVKKDKLYADYAVKSERIHTINQLLKAYALFEKDVEYVVIDNKVKIVDEQTGRIMEGRRYSDGLHQAIEAKENVKVEAATQTFATITLQNYFRMYKKLSGMTGTAETEAKELWDIYELDVVVIPTNRPIARDDREDLVYKTVREKYNAVTDEVVSLTQKGRPVLVGTTSVEVSELLSRMLKMKNIHHNVLNAKLHQREADIVAEAGKKSIVTIATNMAGRGTDIKLSKEVKDAGGLAIVGTERHESRRVDRQLRGRAGRQGDPGSSQFFVSLEDDLMRLFGSGRIAKLMDRMGLEDGEVIQHSMISKSIERAQKKVEENNFGIRKRLLEYDDVMNSQREVIYKRRKHALHGERIGVDIANMFYDSCQTIVEECHGNVPFEEFQLELIKTLSIESPINDEEFKSLKADDIIERVYNVAMKTYKRKTEIIAEQALPVINDVYENQREQYKNIVIPISDGTKVYNIVVNLEKAYESKSKEVVRSYEKNIILLLIDEAWKEHLREMDDLKQSVQTATYEQKDPLLIYKFESYELFKNMLGKINKLVVSILIKGHIPIKDSSQVRQAEKRRKLDMSRYKASKDEYSRGRSGEQGKKKEPEKLQPIRVEKKVGRNDPCPCGSGKKYKQCHGRPGN